MASTVLSFVAVCGSASSIPDPPTEWVEAIERGDRVWGENYSTVGGNLQVSRCHTVMQWLEGVWSGQTGTSVQVCSDRARPSVRRVCSGQTK
jgi:hypothetical protein